jgi:hypothetical protein
VEPARTQAGGPDSSLVASSYRACPEAAVLEACNGTGRADSDNMPWAVVTVRTIAEMWRGSIEVDSTPSAGTTFRVYFPLVSGGEPSRTA